MIMQAEWVSVLDVSCQVECLKNNEGKMAYILIASLLYTVVVFVKR